MKFGGEFDSYWYHFGSKTITKVSLSRLNHYTLAMPRVETGGSENEEEVAGYHNHFNSHLPQHHASIDTRENNGPLWRHNT